MRVVPLLCLALAAPAAAQSGGGAAYAVGGIAVDVAAANPAAARQSAWRIAQRQAWPILWSRLTGKDAKAAPHLSDGQLDGIVAGIESQGERLSATRYIATLGVVFDRSRTADWLAGSGGLIQSPPMLLLPVLVDGGAATVYQAKTPWRGAWQRFAGNVTPIDYVLAEGSAGDNLWLTGWQPGRPDRDLWRDILTRFDTVDVLVAEARLTRSWPGGPVTVLVTARHGPDGETIGRFAMTTRSEEGLDALLDQAVVRADALFSAALRDGRLRAEPDLAFEIAPAADFGGFAAPIIAETAAAAQLDVAAATPDAAALAALEVLLRGTRGVTSVATTSLSLGGSSRIAIGFSGSRAELAYALDQRGWRLASENGLTVLRRRREGEAPLPPVVAPPPPAVPSPTSPGPATPAPANRPPAPPANPAPRPPAASDPVRKPRAAPVTVEKGNAPVELLPNR